MKIVYILSEDLSIVSGISKKIESQTKYWEKFGHEVTIISLKSNNLKPIIDNAIILSRYVIEKNFKKKFLRRVTISKKLDSCLHSISPDMIYTRYIVGIPDIVNVFMKHAKYIVELNTNDVNELKINKMSNYIINQLTRDYFLKNSSGFVSVSKELMLENIYTKFNKKYVVIGNGYDFTNIVKRKYSYNKKAKFLFVGSPGQPWHGLDKILFIANKLEDYEFHFVGPSINELEKIGKISANMIVHGYRDIEYLDGLISKCDIGIATLALHRKDMNEASPLKSREYLANGLGIIIGYKDTDLPEDFEFVLNIGNYENNVIDHIKEIEIFAASIIEINPLSIVNKCYKLLDYESKEKLRISFIEKIFKEEN